MSKFAIIETGGKQYLVRAGEKIRVEKLSSKEGSFTFDKVLLVADGDTVEIGMPYLAKAVVDGKILREARGKKKIIFKYHSKTRYRKKKGHRQTFAEVEVVKV